MSGKSYEAIKYWLLYVKNALRLSDLTGDNYDSVMAKALSYELSSGDYSYCAEMPLMGNAGIDLSVQYSAADFFEGKHFLSAEMKDYDKLFSDYARVLAKDNQQILPFAMLYLEADTFSGDDRNAGIFFNLSGTFVKPVLPKILRLQGLSDYEEKLFDVLDISQEVLVPWQFGFMYSRKDFSVRLVCYLTKDGWYKLPELMDKLGYEKFPKADFDCLKELVVREDTGTLFNIDIMEDGSLGDVIGLEISSLPTRIYEQQRWMEGAAVQYLNGLLKKWDIADARVDMIRDCIFHVGFQKKDMQAFEVTSGFSHFKLRWKKGRRLPAKVYLQVKRDAGR